MASIHIECPVGVSADTAWGALRRVGEPDRLFAPVLTAAELHGDTRTVHFQNGLVLHEKVLDVDAGRRRVAYSALDSPGLTYHHASMEILDEGPGRCRFVWVTDFLPEGAGSGLQPLIQAGADALRANLERIGERLTNTTA